MQRAGINVNIASGLQEPPRAVPYTGALRPRGDVIGASAQAEVGAVLSLIGEVIGASSAKSNAEEEIKGRMAYMQGKALTDLTGSPEAFQFGYQKAKAEADMMSVYTKLEQDMAAEYATKSPEEFNAHVAKTVANATMTDYSEINNMLMEGMSGYMQRLAMQHAGMYTKHVEAERKASTEYTLSVDPEPSADKIANVESDVLANAVRAQLQEGNTKLYDVLKQSDKWKSIPSALRGNIESMRDEADGIIYDKSMDTIKAGIFDINKQLMNGALAPDDVDTSIESLLTANGVGKDSVVGKRLLDTLLTDYYRRESQRELSKVEDDAELALVSKPEYSVFTANISKMTFEQRSAKEIVNYITTKGKEIGLSSEQIARMAKPVGENLQEAKNALARQLASEQRIEARAIQRERIKEKERWTAFHAGQGRSLPISDIKKLYNDIHTTLGNPLTDATAFSTALQYTQSNKDSRLMEMIFEPALYGSPYSNGKINKDMENALGQWKYWEQVDPATAKSALKKMSPKLYSALLSAPDNASVRSVLQAYSNMLSNPATAPALSARDRKLTNTSNKAKVAEKVQDALSTGGLFGFGAKVPTNVTDVVHAAVQYAKSAPMSDDDDAITYGVREAISKSVVVGGSAIYIPKDELFVRRMFPEQEYRTMRDAQHVLKEWEGTKEYKERTKDVNLKNSVVSYDSNMNRFVMHLMKKDGTIVHKSIAPEVIVHEYNMHKKRKSSTVKDVMETP